VVLPPLSRASRQRRKANLLKFNKTYKAGSQESKRSPYFKTFRRDRMVMKELAKSRPCFNEKECLHSDLKGKFYKRSLKREIRTLRYVYYCVLPRLHHSLQYPPDASLIEELEFTYAGWLNTAYYISGKGSSTVDRRYWRPTRIQT